MVVAQDIVLGRPYHTVDLPGYEYGSTSAYQRPLRVKMISWCVDNMNGPSNHLPNQRWYMMGGKFWFRDEADLVIFLLRWS